jgi:hypothetical protein
MLTDRPVIPLKDVHVRFAAADPPEEPNAALSPVRLGICRHGGYVEIFSCQTQTRLKLPDGDVELLIASLKSPGSG